MSEGRSLRSFFFEPGISCSRSKKLDNLIYFLLLSYRDRSRTSQTCSNLPLLCAIFLGTETAVANCAPWRNVLHDFRAKDPETSWKRSSVAKCPCWKPRFSMRSKTKKRVVLPRAEFWSFVSNQPLLSNHWFIIHEYWVTIRSLVTHLKSATIGIISQIEAGHVRLGVFRARRVSQCPSRWTDCCTKSCDLIAATAGCLKVVHGFSIRKTYRNLHGFAYEKLNQNGVASGNFMGFFSPALRTAQETSDRPQNTGEDSLRSSLGMIQVANSKASSIQDFDKFEDVWEFLGKL